MPYLHLDLAKTYLLPSGFRRKGHVFADNTSAIALYEKLGFAERRTLHITVLTNREGIGGC